VSDKYNIILLYVANDVDLLLIHERQH